MNWQDDCLGTVPARCVPVVGMDLNDRFGQPAETEDEEQQSVGPHHTGKEGLTSTLMRKVLHKHGMAVVNTYWPSGPTYFGQWGHESVTD